MLNMAQISICEEVQRQALLPGRKCKLQSAGLWPYLAIGEALGLWLTEKTASWSAERARRHLRWEPHSGRFCEALNQQQDPVIKIQANMPKKILRIYS